jgi:hypothetical protein
MIVPCIRATPHAAASAALPFDQTNATTPKT